MRTSRLAVILFTAAFLVFSWPGLAFADSTEYAYRVNGGAVEIVSCYSQETSAAVPEELDELAVEAIGEGAFSSCSELRELFIPSSVVKIEGDIFGDNSQVTVIGEANSYAYAYCEENNIPFRVGKAPAELAAFVSAFPDVAAKDWFASYVEDLYQQGIVNGDEKGLFNPNSNTTRAEFVKMMAVASGDELASSVQETSFKDVSAGEWYASYVVWAAENGIVNGYGDGTFKPLALVTRAEMIVMQKRYAAYVSATPLPVIVSEMLFSDAEDIGSWAEVEVRELQMAGIINGRGNNRLEPNKYSTRGEVAKMVSCFLSLLKTDNSASEIKGLRVVDGETHYWQDGYLQETSSAIKKENALMVPLEIYGQYKGAVLEQSNEAARMTLPDGRWLNVSSGSSAAETSTGQTITLNQATYVQNGKVFVDIFSIAGFCGDIAATSVDGTAYFVYPQGREIIQDNWLQGPISLAATALVVYSDSYGTSGRGRDLSYTSITPRNYTKTVMLVFEQHGFEDAYSRDGQLLVDAAKTVISHFSAVDPQVLNGTRLVIVSSANPDGLAEGYTNNGPGRCTIVGGVDMNRDWPTSNYQRSTESRYYTLSPLSCNETINLNSLIKTIKPDVLLDIHGWLNGVYGDRSLAAIFNRQMGLPYKSLFSQSSGLKATDVTYLSQAEVEEAYLSGLVGFRGYLAGYGYEQGIQSALVELKSPNAVNTGGLINAILEIAG
ncbi:MAG: S-layer homology domain-containing protein [Bacillota bacterium]|nr:S-layer homology domain-containing protein [Bacillota bacterium]